jgi:DNA-binding NtrC family response regulator
MPPLRERRGDPALLTEHFIVKLSARFGEPVKPLDPATLAWFDRYPWPGNIRELENLICRNFLLAENGVIEIEPPNSAAGSPDDPSTDPMALEFAAAKAVVLERFERKYLQSLLSRANGNVTLAASLAGKERRALGKMLKKHRLGHARPAAG